MFTGIVQAIGAVERAEVQKLWLRVDPRSWPDPIQLGESIAVQGCCLTVTGLDEALSFDLSEETLHRSTLGALSKDMTVNLERSVRAQDRLGGHFVLGHVDGVGRLLARQSRNEGEVFRFRGPIEGAKYLVSKGCVAIDGVSLTIVEPDGPDFDVWLVPHTLAHTTLGGLRVGDRVNVEFDVLAKYVENLGKGRF